MLRALLRPGLEESVTAGLTLQLERAMAKLVQQRQAAPSPPEQPSPPSP